MKKGKCEKKERPVKGKNWMEREEKEVKEECEEGKEKSMLRIWLREDDKGVRITASSDMFVEGKTRYIAHTILLSKRSK